MKVFGLTSSDLDDVEVNDFAENRKSFVIDYIV